MRLTITNRIILLVGIGLTAVATVGVVTYVGINSLHRIAEEVLEGRKVRNALMDAEAVHLRWNNKLGVTLLDPTAKSVEVELDPRQCPFGRWYYAGERQHAEQLFGFLQQPLAQLEAPHNRLHRSAAEIDALLRRGERAAAQAIYRQTVGPTTNELLSLVQNMKQGVEAGRVTSENMKAMAAQRRALILTVGVLAGLGMIAGAVILGRAIPATLKGAVGNIATGSAELATTTAQHERTAAQQAAMVSETATTLDELAASARQSAEQAESAAGFSQKASTLTEQGGQNVQRAVAAMAGLREQIGAVSSQLLVLGEQSGRIGSIANLVRDIAAQTNMLALNAAVEAARAGEHGKGFAVIAAEVRKLADQSKKSAEQAGELVAAILKATSGSVMTAETGGKTVAEVGQLAEEVGRLFESLAGVATSVLQNAQQVLLNVKQQTGALDQLKQAVSTIDAGARETAAGLGQTRAAIQKMNDAAQGLQKLV